MSFTCTRPCLSGNAFVKGLPCHHFHSRFQAYTREKYLGGLRRTQSEQVTLVAHASMASTENFMNDSSNEKIGVLFVCLGNICRSPTAEAVFTYIVENKGLSGKFKIDSAGTIGYHEGEPADGRMKRSALKRGIKLTSISRPIRRSDFEDFDIILAMDRKNLHDINSAFLKWNSDSPLPEGSQNKVKLMCSYSKKFEIDEVPDPYYGGPEGFEKVLDLLEDACENLFNSLTQKV